MPWLCAVNRAATDYRPLQSPLHQWMRKTCIALYDGASQRKELADIDVPYIDFHLRDRGLLKTRIMDGLHQIFIERLKREGAP